MCKISRDFKLALKNAKLTQIRPFYVLNPAGAYGVVYRARDQTNGSYVALKKIRISITSDGIPMTTLREISLLKNLDSYNHPHIVK
jgi:serine/threonine protein kinase